MSFTFRDRMETALVRLLLRLPTAVIRFLAGPPVLREGRTLDPQVQLVIRIRKLAGKKGPAESNVAQARRDLDVAGNQLAPYADPTVQVDGLTVAGRPARRYTPPGVTAPGPCLVFYHGGGFVVGGLESHDRACRDVAAKLPCTVISVDYRLAPEAPFPAAADDATAAFRDVVAQADHLGLDPTRIAVGGDSAGGGLATVTALDTRGDEHPPAAVLAIYPGIEFTMSFPSHTSLETGFILEGDDIRFYREKYLDGADPKAPRASPWYFDDVSGQPPTIVITAGFDPLRDEGDAWAKRLEEAGVDVTHQTHPSLFHGFWNTAGAMPVAAQAVAQALHALRPYLGIHPSRAATRRPLHS